METIAERQERMLMEIGEVMNEDFRKEEISQFYKFLTRVKTMIEWFEFKGNYFRFEDMVYIGGKKFKVSLMNIDPRAMIKDDYRHNDRRPIEVLIELPVETSMNGLNSKKITLNSRDNNFGGMNYNDFLDFVDTVKDWIRYYKPEKYYDYDGRLGGREYSDEMYEDMDLDHIPSSNRLSSIFGKKKKNRDDFDDEDFDLDMIGRKGW